MWARLSRFAGLPPQRLDRTVEEFERDLLPALEQQPGYSGVVVGIDRTAGRAAVFTFWEEEDQLRASDALADRARDQAAATADAPREPIVDRYEIVIRK